MKILLVVLVFSVASSSAWRLWGGPFWGGLETTFALDGVLAPLDSLGLYDATGYSPVPRNLTAEPTPCSWELVDASQTCDNGGLFNGYRYVQRVNGSLDYTVSALYDGNGIIVGIQQNVFVSGAPSNPNNTYQFSEITMFLRNTIGTTDVYSLTAYFVDPSTICDTGRATDALSDEGTGTGLYFQNGPTPSTLIQPPMNRATALTTGWNDNNCFPGMGVHNWYQTETYDPTNCDYIRPVFLLYSKTGSRLEGFGFQFVGTQIAPRFEQPTANVIKLIVGDNTPQCLLDRSKGVGVTTMHVFLRSYPGLQTCIV